jgi:hypothetical protein
LFYLPVALVAFTRFGYLMRRVFFRLMLGDLNVILDGLTELEDKGVQTIDCRRAQFSAQEPILRLRMICQSWKVMFQAEYSSGSPLRMLVDLKASVEHALGRGKSAQPDTKGKPGQLQKTGAASRPAVVGGPVAPAKPAPGKPAIAAPKPPLAAKAAAAGAQSIGSNSAAKTSMLPKSPAKPGSKPVSQSSDAPEFEISPESGCDPESGSPKK